MTTTHYLHPSAKALTGARLGLGWLDRLEALGITIAQLFPRRLPSSVDRLVRRLAVGVGVRQRHC